MSEMNFDWDDLRLFLAVARGQGLARAVDVTGKSAPTLGRRMLSLERRLGQELFERMPRGYALTEEGQAFFEKVSRLEAQLVPMVETGRPERPLIKISAGSWITALLCRRLPELVGTSGARLRFISAEEVLSITRRETLIGVRNQGPEDPLLAGRKIGRIRFATYAIDRTERPWIRVMGATPSSRWVAAQGGSETGVEVTHPRNALDLALAGAGRAVLPCFVGDRETGLQRVSDEIDELAHDQWLVMHQDDRHIPAVRAVITRLVAILKDNCSGA
ncbi:LysR family transcriptional regulator [Dinoroseobacter sp. S124A]|uniref:LysR family transcriptional regulator n=1 Tax=Dinoroseobacter sp. S124A TaxID=3415128 RepID=UPI003C7D47FD